MTVIGSDRCFLITRIAAATLVGIFGGSCTGAIGEKGNGPSVDTEVPKEPETFIATSGLRRLSGAEYFNTIVSLLDAQLPVFNYWPSDARLPFDNNYLQQVASDALIEAADLLAKQAADELLIDTGRLDKIVGCKPKSSTDEACLESFAKSFGKRALRRPVSDEEVKLWLHGTADNPGALGYAEETKDFYAAVHHIVWALLQHPEFLYRVEVGTPVEGQPDVVQLTPYEVASRLSYFVWGSMPDDSLFDRAGDGSLSTPEGRKEEARRMLTDDRAKDRILRFHAMWLGYEQLPHTGELGAGMKKETAALIERVVFEENLPWVDLFTFPETFITPYMAEHYGLPAPSNSEGDWVPYGDSGRAGLFSQGSFLSIGAKFDDTSPVQRGLVIRESLFCMHIDDPPPTVDVDAPPPKVGDGGFCKIDRFNAQITSEGCVNCHKQINPIGYGLENYGPTGAYRTHEPDNAMTPEDESTCEIPGQGQFEAGSFSGPKELGELAVGTGLLQQCLSTQLYRFVSGKTELDALDLGIVHAIQTRMEEGGGDFAFSDLVLEIVGQPSFDHRKMEVQ